MKYLFALLIMIITLSGCQNKSIKDSFECNTKTNFANTEEIKAMLGHFKIQLPSDWKSELYYDEFQSRVYSADTTKQLTETYVIDVTWHQGEIQFNNDFETLVLNDLKINQQLSPLKSGFGSFMDYPGYFNLSIGNQSGFDHHFFQIFIKTAPDEYYTFTTKVYGSEFVEERICASISIFENISILK